MSYEPLHHKYRPKSFAQLVGQEAIATTLTNAIRSAKIAPAYLFTGPRGTGKTSSARILAKSLNCLKSDKPTPEPCGICDTCQGITKGYSLDVIEIDAASNTGVDNIRELIEKAQFAPVQCRYKVYVIDECHMLSTAAFNALLKTLEEPPKHVVFVLATTDPQRVLPTIISRCQRFDFRRIQLDSMVKHLTNIAHQENIQISPDAITLVAQLSQGGLRDAESLLDQLALILGEVTPDQVWDLVGSVGERDLLGLLEAIAQDNAEIVLDTTRKILDRGREPLIILQNLASFYRDLLIAKTAPNRQDLVTCTQQTWSELVSFAQRLDTSAILLGQQHLRTAEVQLKNTTQPRLWLEVTLLGLLPSAILPRNSTPGTSANHYVPTNHNPVSPPPTHNPTHYNGNNSGVSQPSTHNSNNHNGLNSFAPSPTSTPTHHNGTNSGVSQPSPHNPPTHQNGVNFAPQPPNYPPQNHNSPPTPEQISSPPPPVPPVTPQEVEGTAQYDLAQIWQQVCSNIQQIPKRSLLTQMCQLVEFNGAVAYVIVKPMWFDKVKSDLHLVKSAFERVFQSEIQVNLEKFGSSTPSSNRRNTPPQDSTRVQQPPTPNYTQQIPQPVPQSAPVPPLQPTSTPAPPPAAPQSTYTQQPAAPQPAAPPQPLPPPVINKTESVVKNPHPVHNQPPVYKPAANWENDDDVSKAATALAKFFSGEIIRLTDEAFNLADTTDTVREDVEIYEYDED